jgi:hypothetical protein
MYYTSLEIDIMMLAAAFMDDALSGANLHYVLWAHLFNIFLHNGGLILRCLWISSGVHRSQKLLYARGYQHCIEEGTIGN